MRLSTFSYYADFVISTMLITLLVVQMATVNTWMEKAEWALSGCIGVAAWTLIEYAVHRRIYHHAPYFLDMHAAHHADPKAHIGAPPFIGIVLIVVVFFAPMATTSLVIASGLVTGVLAGYTTYMLVHHAAHHWILSPRSWLYRICRHHALHHYQSDHFNFGITTSVWDRVFGTAFDGRCSELKSRVAD